MTLRQFGGLVAGLLALAASAPLVLAPDAAWAQQVDPAVNDLRQYDVTFEDGTLTTSELDQLDAALGRLQGDDGYVKAVVLGSDVTAFDSNRAFADDIRRRLGGDGSVIVYSPDEVGIASSVASSSEVTDAEGAAADRLNSGDSYAAASTAAARELGVSSSAGDAGDDDGSSFPWVWLIVLLALPLLLLWFLWRSARKYQNRAAKLSAQEIGAAETTVRTAVDKVANDLLELADRADQPDTAPEARAAFSQGGQMFTDMQGMLEEADTRPELEAAYAKVNEASYQLDVARALMDGQPAPAKTEPAELFPRPAPAPRPAPGQVPEPAPVPSQPAPEVHYRKPDMSPWITAAAMAAMTMLSQRGMSQPQTRPPMNDSAFGSWINRLPSPSQSRSTSAGRRGGSRGRGPVVTPSGQRRERGMGRR